jgi:hypothetical protein
MSNPTFAHWNYRGVTVTEKFYGNSSEFTWVHEVKPGRVICSKGFCRTLQGVKRAISKHLKSLTQ